MTDAAASPDRPRGARGDVPGEAPGQAQEERPTPPPEGGLSRLLGLRVASILAARYVDLKLGDPLGLALLLAQAPLIGWLVALAFDGQKEAQRIDFVLSLVAVWFGCFNGCREVVKERLIMLRERRMGVPVRSYVLSKLGVLAVLAAVQVLLLVAVVGLRVSWVGSPPFVFLSLVLTSLCGTALGLFLSSIVSSQNSLIALVPIALIPQLIFSKAVLQSPTELVSRIQDGMIAAWGLELLTELRKTNVFLVPCLKSAAVLVAMTFLFLVLSGLGVAAQDE